MTSNLQLSPHFTLREMCKSATADRLGIANIPNERQLSNLYRLAKTMEVARHILSEKAGKEVRIITQSGLRVLALNKNIPGSSKTSLHLDGCAIDFTAEDFGTPFEVATALAESDMTFEELIYEYRSWVHLGITRSPTDHKPKRELWTKVSGLPYQKGIRDI